MSSASPLLERASPPPPVANLLAGCCCLAASIFQLPMLSHLMCFQALLGGRGGGATSTRASASNMRSWAWRSTAYTMCEMARNCCRLMVAAVLPSPMTWLMTLRRAAPCTQQHHAWSGAGNLCCAVRCCGRLSHRQGGAPTIRRTCSSSDMWSSTACRVTRPSCEPGSLEKCRA